VGEPASLSAALDGVGLVVNAVGPYSYDPTPLVTACVEHGVHYLDLAEGARFIDLARRAASGARVVVVSGCSTVPGLIELLARPFFALPDTRRVDAWLSMGTANAVSGALLHGLLAPLGRVAPDGERYFGRVLTHVVGGRRLRFGRHPTGLEGSELALRLFVGFDRGLLVRALCGSAPLLARLGEPELGRLARLGAPLASLARPFGTPRGVLRVEAIGEGERILASVEVEAAAAGLDVPALPAVWVAARLALEAPDCTGAATLADLVSCEEALAELRSAGLAVREVSTGS
jgi:hypothetical protein